MQLPEKPARVSLVSREKHDPFSSNWASSPSKQQIQAQDTSPPGPFPSVLPPANLFAPERYRALFPPGNTATTPERTASVRSRHSLVGRPLSSSAIIGTGTGNRSDLTPTATRLAPIQSKAEADTEETILVISNSLTPKASREGSSDTERSAAPAPAPSSQASREVLITRPSEDVNDNTCTGRCTSRYSAKRLSRSSIHAEKQAENTKTIESSEASASASGTWTGKGNYMINPNTNRKMRRYELHQGFNKFYLAGHIMTSSDSPLPFIISLMIAFLFPTGFLIFNASWMWHNIYHGGAAVIVFAYLTLLMWVNMLRTAGHDPGILPRHLHKPDMELIACPPGAPEDLGNGMAERPVPRYIRVRDGLVVSKWCETCETYRPPRTSHCRLCNNCVEKTDHHCSYLNNCIGSKNYTCFFVFLVASILCLLFVVAFSIAHLVMVHSETHHIFNTWAQIGSIIFLILSFAIGCPVVGLLGYHIRLVWSGKTTIESLRTRPERKEARELFAMSNPWRNAIFSLCKPMTASSHVQLWKHARRDDRLDPV